MTTREKQYVRRERAGAKEDQKNLKKYLAAPSSTEVEKLAKEFWEVWFANMWHVRCTPFTSIDKNSQRCWRAVARHVLKGGRK